IATCLVKVCKVWDDWEVHRYGNANLGQVRRTRHEEEIDVLEYQILAREIVPTLKTLKEIIQENVFLPMGESKSQERIVAQEEVVTPRLLLSPLTNHPPHILMMMMMMMMMMEMVKGPRVQAPLHPFIILSKLDTKADIGIFVGYVTAKKAFRIYNKRTQKIIETIHVTFDELTSMASEQPGSGPGLQCMTPTTSSSGLVPNPIPQQPCIAAPRYDWDRLFQPMFDEYFTPPSIVVSLDAPSTTTPSTQEQEQSPNISQGLEESLKTSIFPDDPLNESPHEVSTSQGSSPNVRQTHTPFESLGR
nr:integrase, catalytic region, zinc finger, CCHC-type, peptidase aspartic, catalytic [Tanacetum cinerariifolium]